jgi:hypothetical protein
MSLDLLSEAIDLLLMVIDLLLVMLPQEGQLLLLLLPKLVENNKFMTTIVRGPITWS